MSGSKPEELVAKLYDEGMTDDEVKAQLSDFGLSGREIHALMKKAQSILADANKKKAKAPLQFSSEPPGKVAPRGISEYTGIVKKGSGITIEPPSLDDESELIEKPIEELGTGGLDRFWSQKAGTKEPSDEIAGLKSMLPREPPLAIAKKEERPGGKKGESEKKSFFGLFGKKGAGQKEAPGEKPVSPPADPKLDGLRSMIGAPPQSKPPFEPGNKGGDSKGAGKADKKEDKKADKKEDKKADKKEDKKGGKKSASENENYQIKMKRLLLIKDAISRPITSSGASDFANIDENLSQEKEEPFEARVPELPKLPEPAKPKAAMQPKQKEFPRLADEITLTTNEDEEKMDQELASKLLGNMKNMETEMGEIKQLLETLRELNIKLIEILETRK